MSNHYMGGILGMYLQEVFLPQQVQYKCTENYFTIEINRKSGRKVFSLVSITDRIVLLN